MAHPGAPLVGGASGDPGCVGGACAAVTGLVRRYESAARVMLVVC